MKHCKAEGIVALLCVGSVLLTGCENVSVSEEAQEKLNQKIAEGYVETMAEERQIAAESMNFFKLTDEGNPLITEMYCADPTAVEYNGRLYVFGTNDQQQYEANGQGGSNTYEAITSFVILSTEDMVNWTYHGIIDTKAVAPWIISSWAPSVVSRVEEDGLTHFYLYFSNNGCGVGVITATDPLGPWTDPRGKALVFAGMAGLGGVPNPFDPGAVIDDNGVGWLSFGGGMTASGSDYYPGSTRIAQLGADMISFESRFVEIPAPYFYEASELNYINGIWVYTYNTSWASRSQWNDSNCSFPPLCSMAYMTSTNPLDAGSWVYRGNYFTAPGECGYPSSNNHTHFHQYQGNYYMLYHTLQLEAARGKAGGFRSLCVTNLTIDEATATITPTQPTSETVAQLKNVDAYAQNDARSISHNADMTYLSDEENHTIALASVKQGAWMCVKGVDFGDRASVFTAKVRGTGTIAVRLDAPDGKTVGILTFDAADDWQGVYARLTKNIEGVHDLYLVFSDADMVIESWQFL